MEIELDPPNGITGFPFGMPREEVRRAAESIGEVQTLNDGPPQPWSVTQIDVVHPHFAITFNIEDTKTLTSVEVWRPQPGPKEIRVTWRRIDIFDTPANEVLDAIEAAGFDIEDRDGFNPEVPHLTLGFGREPSDDNPINDRHMPTYFTSVLAAPKAYYD